VLPAGGATLRVYLTAAFRGRSAPAYTIDLGVPSPSGPGLLAGPGALGAPRAGAEAEAERARKEKERKEREEKAKAEGKGGADGAEGGEAAAEAEPKPAALLKAERRNAEASSDEEVGVRFGFGRRGPRPVASPALAGALVV
jgi:hypothetical protein